MAQDEFTKDNECYTGCIPESGPNFTVAGSAETDNTFIESVVSESLAIGGGNINVFKLLGIHEQGDLVNLASNTGGVAITSNKLPGFDPCRAFQVSCNFYRSRETGPAVLTSAFIGYDFGEIKLDNNRNRYGIPTSVRHNIAAVGLQQGASSTRRATKVRLERSDDGIKWKGVGISDVPDNDDINTLYFKHSVPSRYWRIRPLEFNGVASNQNWEVMTMRLYDYEKTQLDTIQDEIFMENRDRDYSDQVFQLKAQYDLVDVQTELTRFGIELPSLIVYFDINFSQCVAALGRPIVIGDIIELPSMAQFTAELERIPKYLEVTDVTWSVQGYTPAYQPTMLKVTAQQMMGSPETQDIFDGMESNVIDDVGLVDNDDGFHPIIQDYSNAGQSAYNQADSMVPERGSDEKQDLTLLDNDKLRDFINKNGKVAENLNKSNYCNKDRYVQDAMPPNGCKYTQGDVFPDNPKDGQYHRLTYDRIEDGIPARLYRWSLIKNRWLYQETDRREGLTPIKPILQDFLSDKEHMVKPEDIR